jgi:hypothetical protein
MSAISQKLSLRNWNLSRGDFNLSPGESDRKSNLLFEYSDSREHGFATLTAESEWARLSLGACHSAGMFHDPLDLLRVSFFANRVTILVQSWILSGGCISQVA